MITRRRAPAAALLVVTGGLLGTLASDAQAAPYVAQASAGPPVRVCMIDTGVPVGTPGVVERLTATGSLDATDPHGAQMAAIITTAYPAAQIVSVQKVDGRTTATTTADVVDMCVARSSAVISMSFTLAESSFDRPGLQTAVDRARAAGVVLVAAAGNGGRVDAPANLTGVIGVGAVGADGNPCAFSAAGQGLVMAPGCDVDGTPTEGTSDAAAYIAGAAAALAGTRGLSGAALEGVTREAGYRLAGRVDGAGDETHEADDAGAYLWVARRTSTRVTVALRGGRPLVVPLVRITGRAVTRRGVTMRISGSRVRATARCPGRPARSLTLRRPPVGSGRAVLLPTCAP